MSRYDVIVIGAGHNGLAAAAYLAKAGRKVLVVERRDRVGGLAAAEEFHPGYRSAGVLHDTTGVRRWVVEELGLESHGLKFRAEPAPVFVPMEAGKGYLHFTDPAKAEGEIAALSAKDAKAYAEYRAFVKRISPFLRKVFDDQPPDVLSMSFPGLWDLGKKAVSLRMLGKADMMEVLRIGPMCVADWVGEWFESEVLKSCLAGPAIYSTYTGPWSPGSNANLLLAECLAEASVAGGPAALARALEKAAKAYGVEIRTGVEVRELAFDGSAVSGVTLVTGETISAKKVVSSLDPKRLFLELVPPCRLSSRFEQNIMHYRARGTTAHLNLALAGYPELRGRPGLEAVYVRTGTHLDELERAFDAVKYREFSQAPVLDVYFPSLEDPTLAPSGHHVASVGIHFAPYDLAGGWTEERKKELLSVALARLSEAFPNVRDLIVGHELLTPVDLEARYGVTGGHLHHGEHSADQLLVRPTPECSRYKTPFPGLYLCGAGSHPGGGITCAPGGLAAKAILSE